ncbi:MAG TPA: NAD(P)H-dependent oxidoreductase subunit E [Limnochordia bacterium]
MKKPAWVEERAAEIEQIIARYPKKQSAVMPLLHLAQECRGYVAREDMAAIGEILGLTEASVESVCTFYSLFYREPVGKYVIHVCNNLTCGLCGSERLVKKLEELLGIRAGQTTPDGLVTLLVTGECIAACDGAPAMQVNLEYFLKVNDARAEEIVAALRRGEDAAALADRIGQPAVEAR